LPKFGGVGTGGSGQFGAGNGRFRALFEMWVKHSHQWPGYTGKHPEGRYDGIRQGALAAFPR
jgi:hypothetical protein